MSAILSWAPATGELLGEIETTPPSEAVRLINRARSAQKEWGRLGAVNRAEIVNTAARILERKRERLSITLAQEVGKPIGEARGEVTRVRQILEYYGGLGRDLGGNLYSSSDANTAILTRQTPVGVAGVITPWNFPAAIPAWKIVPALVAGCAVVWKPASAAVLTGEHLCDILHEAGVPLDVLTMAVGGSELGSALADGPVDAVSFTGSTAVGKHLRDRIGPRPIRLTLELGGVNVAHVLSDANIASAAQNIANAAFGYAGQKCTATQIVAVSERVVDDLVEALRSIVVGIHVGDPMDENSFMGPVIDSDSATRITAEIAQETASSELLAAAPIPDGAAFVAPTLLRSESKKTRLSSVEVFGPVAALMVTKDLTDHARIADDTGAGLTSAVYGKDNDAIRELLNVVNTGVVAINRPSTGLDPHVPFGGWGESGGEFSEQGRPGIDFFTKNQTIYWRSESPDGIFP